MWRTVSASCRCAWVCVRSDKQKIYRSGPVMPLLDLESLKAIVAREEPVIDVANSICFVPVRMGVRQIGQTEDLSLRPGDAVARFGKPQSDCRARRAGD